MLGVLSSERRGARFMAKCENCECVAIEKRLNTLIVWLAQIPGVLSANEAEKLLDVGKR